MARLPTTHRFRTSPQRPTRPIGDIIREMSQDPNSILAGFKDKLYGPRRENKEKGGER